MWINPFLSEGEKVVPHNGASPVSVWLVGGARILGKLVSIDDKFNQGDVEEGYDGGLGRDIWI